MIDWMGGPDNGPRRKRKQQRPADSGGLSWLYVGLVILGILALLIMLALTVVVMATR